MTKPGTSLDLFPIGNCSVNAMIDTKARVVWACFPRPDSAPVFSALLEPVCGGSQESGFFEITLNNLATLSQSYVRNTPILRTLLRDEDGNEAEIIDYCPRFRQYGRIYRPLSFVRLIRPLKGTPQLIVRLRPTVATGTAAATALPGSSHISFDCNETRLRVTTNAPLTYVLKETPFRLEEPIAFYVGPDEGYPSDVLSDAERMLNSTLRHWQEWVRHLYLPLDWQEAVIRAAITLKLCTYEDTGAIMAALTTSIPEAPGSGRNWDYRYCWIRDAYYVVRALNRLGDVEILENYLGFLRNLVDLSSGGHVQPLYSIGLRAELTETIADGFEGYRGMGPVRFGNQAHEHFQNDVYGQIVLPLVQSFMDQRFLRLGTLEDFHALEKVGERAFAVHDQPDAGLWEFRTKAQVHTYSVLLCWAACDRLANAAETLGLPERRDVWVKRAQIIRESIETRAFNKELGHFCASFDGNELDASLLQLFELGFLEASDPRCKATFEAVEKGLRRGDNLFRYADPDDFGMPETAFNFCTFWYIEGLHMYGRDEEARELFEALLNRRTQAGLLSEDVSLTDGELWGNYPQTYSLVGLITCAALLSRSWTALR